MRHRITERRRPCPTCSIPTSDTIRIIPVAMNIMNLGASNRSSAPHSFCGLKTQCSAWRCGLRHDKIEHQIVDSHPTHSIFGYPMTSQLQLDPVTQTSVWRFEVVSKFYTKRVIRFPAPNQGNPFEKAMECLLTSVKWHNNSTVGASPLAICRRPCTVCAHPTFPATDTWEPELCYELWLMARKVEAWKRANKPTSFQDNDTQTGISRNTESGTVYQRVGTNPFTSWLKSLKSNLEPAMCTWRLYSPVMGTVARIPFSSVTAGAAMAHTGQPSNQVQQKMVWSNMHTVRKKTIF